MQVQAHTMELTGTAYEIGRQQGQIIAQIPPLLTSHTSPMTEFSPEEMATALDTLNRWCPGLTDELQGFADALGIAPSRVAYYSMTCLVPRCSQFAVSPAMTKAGHPLLARSYEFSHEMEDFCLVKTSVEGKYTHMGTSTFTFGRDDGFNEHGLAVTMSSCGFPVGPMSFMRAPQLRGLHFWAVIRTLLENCKDVEECLAYIRDMPIAYNLNMILADRGGRAALVETLDGRMAVKHLESGSFLHATNHPVLPELDPHEPRAMRHSLVRADWIRNQLTGAADLTVDDLKAMLHSEYPQGLNCHFYKDFLGTTKSMVIDPVSGTIDLCWGGESANGWNRYEIDQPLPSTSTTIQLHNVPFSPALADYLPLEQSGD